MISAAEWKRYVDRLAAIDERAGQAMREYIRRYGTDNRQALIEYAYGLATKYGEASAAMAAEMYDAIAATAPKAIAAAQVAETATGEEVGKAMNAILEKSVNENAIAGGVTRLVKRAGADTVLQNAVRDQAEYAWIPSGGETCAFCLMLASNGWKPAGKKSLSGGHATHIHPNCKCTYAVRFTHKEDIPGYKPEEYLAELKDAPLRDGEKDLWVNRVEALRRQKDEENREKINAQKREAYAARREAEAKREGKA